MSKQKIILYAFWGGVFSLLAVGVTLYLDLYKKNSLADTVVVQVNKETLTASELSQKLVHLLESYDLVMAKDPQVVEFSKNKIVDDYIHETLLLDWAERNNIEITEAEIDSEVTKIRANYPDDISFKEALSQSQQSLTDWKDRIAKKILQKKIFDFLYKKIDPPSEDEMRSYYNSNRDEFKKKNSVRLRQVVLENEDQANRIYYSLTPQTSLSEIAKKYSHAPEASAGGDIGWIEQGTLDIFDKAFSMRVGQRSGVIKSPYGFHIFEVLEKRGEYTAPYESVMENIRRTLASNKEQAIYSAWLEEQIRNAKIFKNQDAIRAISVKPLGD